jgi:ectoine hydroxylase-related dioxygenase (phytanoyl-CoA dioxygenase family)
MEDLLRKNLLTVALDHCTPDNGCLQVLKGSLELVYAQMEPGDGLFFHCNTLHRSDQNCSPNRRWTVLCCYNAARNNPLPGFETALALCRSKGQAGPLLLQSGKIAKYFACYLQSVEIRCLLSETLLSLANQTQ